MEITRQKISNHPTISDIKREVVVYRSADNSDVMQITINARIEHFKDNILLPEFTREVNNWIISNDYEINMRDDDNNIILDEDGKEIKIKAFDSYHAKLIEFLIPLLNQGIINDDEELKRFDK